MDLALVETLIPKAAQLLGIEPSTLVFYLLLVTGVCHVVGKMIPDDATGWKAVVREVCKKIGLVVSNRIKARITQADVVKQIVGEVHDSAKANEITGSAAEATALIPATVDVIAEESPKIVVRDPIGSYVRRTLKDEE